MADHVLGAISVEAVLTGGVRDVRRVLTSRPDRHRRLLETASVPVEVVDEAVLDDLGRGHAGIAAEVGERRFADPGDLLAGSFLVHLDGIEDPFNFGQAVRTLYAAGCDGVVVAPRNWTTATATVTRSSAGATELIPMAVAEVQDLVAAVGDRLVLATTGEADAPAVWDVDLSGPLLVLIGGEHRGVTRSVLASVDAVRVPYGRDWDKSLGTVAATAALAFEVLRQRS